MTRLLRADEAARDAECGGNLCKDDEVERRMSADRLVLILLKIARERRLTDDVGTARVADDIRQMRRARPHEPLAHGIREEAHVLADDKDVQETAACGGVFDEILVPECERVRVEHDRTDVLICACGRLCLPFGKHPGKSVGAVLHKDHAAWHARDLVESELLKIRCGRRFRIEKDVPVPARRLYAHEVIEQTAQHPLAAVFGDDRKTAQCIPRTAPRRNKCAVRIADRAGVVHMRVKPQPLVL